MLNPADVHHWTYPVRYSTVPGPDGKVIGQVYDPDSLEFVTVGRFDGPSAFAVALRSGLPPYIDSSTTEGNP